MTWTTWIKFKTQIKICKTYIEPNKNEISLNKNKSTHSSISMKPKTHVLMIQDRMDGLNQLEAQ